MKEYEVVITEVLKKKVKVKAKNKNEALNKVLDMYNNEEIVLTADDFYNYDISI